MTVTLGIFDLFTYAVPGSIQLAFFAYLAVRLNVVDLADVNSVPGLVLAMVVAVVSYLLGHLTYLVSSIVDKVYRRPKDGSDAWMAVAQDAARAGGREVPRMHPMLLLAGAELRDQEVATEVGRLRAVGLMLRNVVVPTCLAAGAAIVEVVVGPQRWLAGGLAALLVLAVFGFARQGQRLRRWADIKTYQIAYWMDLPPAGTPRPGAPCEEAKA